VFLTLDGRFKLSDDGRLFDLASDFDEPHDLAGSVGRLLSVIRANDRESVHPVRRLSRRQNVLCCLV
jgi:hypothetical protein